MDLSFSFGKLMDYVLGKGLLFRGPFTLKNQQLTEVDTQEKANQACELISVLLATDPDAHLSIIVLLEHPFFKEIG